MNNESVPRTLMIALCVALVCSALVTSAVHFLRPLQDAYGQLERNRAVVEAAGRLPAGEVSAFDVLALFRELEASSMDLESDGTDSRDNITSSDVSTTQATGAVSASTVTVYLSRSGNKIQRAILPVEGAGMWSTIYAYVGINVADLSIADVVFYRHGETPGIGDRIQQPDWRRQWYGKRIYNDAMEAIFNVVNNAAGPHQVDAISGATITSIAVGNMVSAWMNKPAYKTFLQQIQNQGRP